MIHIFNKGASGSTILLLHGTGANEHDLLDIAKMVAPNDNVLSVRGNVLENGMPRFFERLSMGVFNQESLEKETEYLVNFVKQSAEKYGFDLNKLNVLGYSNGANIAVNIIFNHKNFFNKAVLLKPVIPNDEVLVDATTTKVFIGAGSNDPLTTVETTNKLNDILSKISKNVELKFYSYGHSLSMEEITDATNWYKLI